MQRALSLFGLALAMALAAAFLACGDDATEVTPAPSGTAATSPSATFRTKSVPAPIDALDIRVAESFPPQYFLHVVSGLPSGCAKFERYTVDRKGETIEVKVTNTVPADENIACTAIYGQVEHNIPLGSDFQSGKTYTVKVNDKVKTFLAQ